MSAAALQPSGRAAPSNAQLVLLVATSAALAALGIDALLPALPQIGQQMQVPIENHLQWLVSGYFLGLGLGQLVFGTLSDALGRKPVLIGGVLSYVLVSAASTLLTSFAALLIARAVQGFCIAAASVVTRSIVRDLHRGPTMAKVLSTAFAVFLLVPIVGPAFGQVLLLFAPWRTLLLIMAALGLLHLCWFGPRWPETLPQLARRKPELGHLRAVTRFVLSEPHSLFCSLASALLGGWMLAYVAMMPQLFQHTFGPPQWMPGALAIGASAMAAGSLLSARLVERLGPMRIARTALGAFVVSAVVHWGWTYAGRETLLSFIFFQAFTLTALGLTSSNLSASAMENMGEVAGAAASLQGVITLAGSAILSSLIGSQLRDSVGWIPMSALLSGLVASGLLLALSCRTRGPRANSPWIVKAAPDSRVAVGCTNSRN